jgi:hypothetical protein
MIPIEGHKNLYRDEETGAIINTDNYEYLNYTKIKKEKLKQKFEIENLKNELSEIKLLLRRLLDESSRD